MPVRASTLDKFRVETSEQFRTRDEALEWLVGQLRIISAGYPTRPNDAEPDSEFLRVLPTSEHTRTRSGNKLLEWWYFSGRGQDDYALILKEI